jgi:hypothetical protein
VPLTSQAQSGPIEESGPFEDFGPVEESSLIVELWLH